MGEGKNVVDMSCGQGKQDLARDRDAGHDHEEAVEIFEGLERTRRPGDFNSVIELDRSTEVTKKAKALRGIDAIQHIEVNPDGSVVLREAYGIGPGRRVSKRELDALDQHKLDDTGVTTTRNSDDFAPRAQLSRAQKKAKRGASKEPSDAQRRKAAGDAAIAQERGPDETHRCRGCSASYLTSGGLLTHMAKGCKPCPRRRRGVLDCLESIDEEAVREERQERLDLALVRVALPKNHGLCFETVEDRVVVSDVAGAAAASLVVGSAYILRDVGSTHFGAPGDTDAEEAVAAALASESEDSVDFVFERPAPPLPPRGWARKALVKRGKPRFDSEQKEYLDKAFYSSQRGGERKREKKVARLMKEHFGRLKTDDGEPKALKESQIRNYFSRLASVQKRRAMDAALAEKDDGEDDDGEDDDGGDVDGNDGEDDDGYERLTVPQLRELLKKCKLETSGRKSELVERLRGAEDADEA